MQTPGKCVSKEVCEYYIFHPTDECIDSLPFAIWNDCDYHITINEDWDEVLNDGDHIIVKGDNIEVVCEENFKLKYDLI